MFGKKIQIKKFGVNDRLTTLSKSLQVDYLSCYLGELQAETVVEEPSYFDRDYLAEFAAFYSVSSKGYPNRCSRLHFFSSNITRDTLKRAAGGGKPSLKKLQCSYLGFIIIRPIPAAPLGRTVLKWYPDDQDRAKHTPRVKNPSRIYFVHFAGIELTIEGLAWQQQDTGVGACATVSLWSMLHSSAFDDHHAIPTTAQITTSAHSKHSFGSRVFPSKGLNFFQICDAIREQNLAPLITDGDLKESGTTVGFSRERFSGSCASFIRSGYPVLIVGKLDGDGHAICLVGYRSCVPEKSDPKIPILAESNIEYIYIHDDNLGPNVRFEINVINNGVGDVVTLTPSAPAPRFIHTDNCPTDGYGVFIPTQLIVAVHDDIRTYPDTLHRAGIDHATYLSEKLNLLAAKTNSLPLGLIVSSRYIKLADFLGRELRARISDNKILSRVRFYLSEKVAPMSLHIGVVRIALDNSTPLIDILYDTTDSDRNHPVYAHISYAPIMPILAEILEAEHKGEFGICVHAFG